MKVFSKELLDKFAANHADSVKAIDRWINTFEQSTFANHNELKLLFPIADYIGRSRYVFNIKGNNYRLLVVVSFINDSAFVRFIGTHAEYDKINCLTV